MAWLGGTQHKLWPDRHSPRPRLHHTHGRHIWASRPHRGMPTSHLTGRVIPPAALLLGTINATTVAHCQPAGPSGSGWRSRAALPTPATYRQARRMCRRRRGTNKCYPAGPRTWVELEHKPHKSRRHEPLISRHGVWALQSPHSGLVPTGRVRAHPPIATPETGGDQRSSEYIRRLTAVFRMRCTEGPFRRPTWVRGLWAEKRIGC